MNLIMNCTFLTLEANCVFVMFTILLSLFMFGFGMRFGIKEMKTKDNKKDKIKTLLFSIYVSASIASMTFFLHLSFLQLLFVLSLISLKTKTDYLYSYLDLLIISGIGLIISIFLLLDIKVNILLYAIICIGVYIYPLIGYFDRKNYVIKKIKRCTEEVDAKIIKIYTGSEDEHPSFKVYIPQFEFQLNGQTYQFMDSSNIYFKKKNLYNVGDSIKLFVAPNPKFDIIGSSEDVFLPDLSKQFEMDRNIKFFYIFSLITFGFVAIVMVFG